jgi:nitrogen fixation/metabolism regulation signal transduction histidine kinase
VWQAIASKPQPLTAPWQMQLTLTAPSGETQTLLLRAAPLMQKDGVGVLLVFDDVSEVMLAQKAQAWSEVARRLAHEIKNPLTPIQLSAERLAAKLADKLSGNDIDLLKRSTGTIVTQVATLKNMVDEFRNYARLPQAQLAPMALHGLLDEVLELYKGRVTAALVATQDGIMGDANQLRQVLHNVLGNALDAATALHPTAAQVLLRTDIVDGAVRLRVTDNGAGFSSESLAKLFEPYHTTKAQGTGLGLAIVHRIVQDHGAKIVVKNRISTVPLEGVSATRIDGAQVDIIFPLHNS